jgi:hypothetical protein
MPSATTLLPPPPEPTPEPPATGEGLPALEGVDAPGRRSLARLLSGEELAGALRHQARGCPGAEAAVELVIRHGYWIDRPAFRDHVDAHPSLDRTDEVMACVDWARLAAQPLPGPTEAQTVLAVAGALAGRSGPGLATIGSLPSETLRLVLRAVLHAAAGPRSLPVAIGPFAVV